MESAFLILSLLGCVALSLYGMKVMSQGILKVAGSHVRASLRRITTSPLRCGWTGTWITAVIQSSSATSVMTMGLAATGLIALSQSFAIMMGANVGATVSAWIIALLGYCWNARHLALPLVVLALPFTYSSRIKLKPWGETLMGTALYVLGFATFVTMMPDAEAMPEAATWVAGVASHGYLSVLLFVVLGIVTTLVFRSSVATLLLAMSLVVGEWVFMPLAVAIIIGDNVGSSLTALLAARGANALARRSALAYLLFNVFGMAWALVLIFPISEVLWQVVSLGTGEPTRAELAVGVAAFHTAFNAVTALLLIGFIPQMQRLVMRLLPVTDADDEELSLRFIQGGLLSTAELSVEEAARETALFGERCVNMLRLTDDLLRMSPTNAAYTHTFSRIEKYEKITDRLELEIVRYLEEIDTTAISGSVAGRVRSLFKIVDELESVGDVCYKMACNIVRRNEQKIRFTTVQQHNLDKMLALVSEALGTMSALLQRPEVTQAELQRAYNQEDAINMLRGQLRELNVRSVQYGDYAYPSGIIYMDLVNGCEKIGDHVINVVEAHAGQE